MKTIYLIRHSNQYKNINYQNDSLDEYTQNILIPLSSKIKEEKK